MISDQRPDLDKIVYSEIEFVVDKVHFNADCLPQDPT